MRGSTRRSRARKNGHAHRLDHNVRTARATMSSNRKQKRGHFCWCCGRIRANERFSGRGHARHICKECSKLGNEELAYRQAVRDIDRLVDWNGVVRRKQRKSFEQFLCHPNERIRLYAKEVPAGGVQARESLWQERLAWEAEELTFDADADAGVAGILDDLD